MSAVSSRVMPSMLMRKLTSMLPSMPESPAVMTTGCRPSGRKRVAKNVMGKTVLEFQNIGKQVEDEALFGTVALDPVKLEQKLAEPPWPELPLKQTLNLISAATTLAKLTALIETDHRPRVLAAAEARATQLQELLPEEGPA